MVTATGRKCALDLVNVPFPAPGPAELPGAEALLVCPSFLEWPTAYGACWDAYWSDLYFPVIAVGCMSFDEESRVLVIAFGGPVLETHWDAALVTRLEGCPFASGQLSCRVAEAEPSGFGL
jgi:hypothetical protein